ncbi:hypothetical protein Droror1_Dr00020128 [Drosera rotundifolia]
MSLLFCQDDEAFAVGNGSVLFLGSSCAIRTVDAIHPQLLKLFVLRVQGLDFCCDFSKSKRR